MGILWFVLDLRTISPSLLRELKQSLLQLANYYAVNTGKSYDGLKTRSKPLPDRIGLCYLFTNRISCSPEMKVAYSPIGDFNLRDFHQAVNTLPTDALEYNSSGALSFTDLKISSVLNDKVLCSWGERDKPVAQKLLLLSHERMTRESIFVVRTPRGVMLPREGCNNRYLLDSSFAPDAPLVRVNEHIDERGQYFVTKLLDGMHKLGQKTMVDAFYEVDFHTKTWQVRKKIFDIVSEFMEQEQNGTYQNLWFGGSTEEIRTILKYGFVSSGPAIYLSPLESPLASLRSCVEDENGLHHLMLCRVLLGRSEVVSPATLRGCPSSEMYHSGVDSLLSPQVYTVWSSNMNTHILPQYVVSFTPPDCNFFRALYELTSTLSMESIRKLLRIRTDFKEGMMSSHAFRQKFEELVGLPFLNWTLGSNNRSRDVLPQHGQSRIYSSSSTRVSKTSTLPENVVRFRPPDPFEEKAKPEAFFLKVMYKLTWKLPMCTFQKVLKCRSALEVEDMTEKDFNLKMIELVEPSLLYGTIERVLEEENSAPNSAPNNGYGIKKREASD